MLRTIQLLLEMAWGCFQLPQHKIQSLNFTPQYPVLVQNTTKVHVQKRYIVGVDPELCKSFVKTPVVASWSSWLFEFGSEILKL